MSMITNADDTALPRSLAMSRIRQVSTKVARRNRQWACRLSRPRGRTRVAGSISAGAVARRLPGSNQSPCPKESAPCGWRMSQRCSIHSTTRDDTRPWPRRHSTTREDNRRGEEEWWPAGLDFRPGHGGRRSATTLEGRTRLNEKIELSVARDSPFGAEDRRSFRRIRSDRPDLPSPRGPLFRARRRDDQRASGIASGRARRHVEPRGQPPERAGRAGRPRRGHRGIPS